MIIPRLPGVFLARPYRSFSAPVAGGSHWRDCGNPLAAALELGKIRHPALVWAYLRPGVGLLLGRCCAVSWSQPDRAHRTGDLKLVFPGIIKLRTVEKFACVRVHLHIGGIGAENWSALALDRLILTTLFPRAAAGKFSRPVGATANSDRHRTQAVSIADGDCKRRRTVVDWWRDRPE